MRQSLSLVNIVVFIKTKMLFLVCASILFSCNKNNYCDEFADIFVLDSLEMKRKVIVIGMIVIMLIIIKPLEIILTKVE